MSVSFWKMTPQMVFLGGRKEAEWLAENFSGTDIDCSYSKLTISDDMLKEARRRVKPPMTDEEHELNKKMFKMLEEMLSEHKKLHEKDDAGGKDWFDIEISW